jgi:2-keto-3-deoxy-L-rhamnonate aldolase RhmA
MTREERYAAFQDRYRRREIIVGMTCSTMSPVLAEIIGHAGFDFVTIDCEVMSINPETVENMVRSAEVSNTIPIIKLKSDDPIVISDALNTGAPMIKLPHATSADALKRAMDATYFRPKGHRGLCTVSRSNRYGQGKMVDLIEWTNRSVQIIPIIEDREAVERIDEIMSVPGIDVYDVGPVDLSHSYDLQPDKGFANPQVDQALQRILEAADKHGKHVMTVPVFGQELTTELTRERLIQRGVKMIFYRTDSVNMKFVARNALMLKVQ